MRAIQSLKTRRDQEDGFTLIELMVVVLIIAILIAIAIPTFLGMRERAQNSAAKSDLRNALAAAKTFYTDNETYVGGNAAALDAIEPSLTYDDDITAVDADSVSIGGQTVDSVLLIRASKAGDYYCMAETANGTTTDSDAALGNVDTVAECTGGNGW